MFNLTTLALRTAPWAAVAALGLTLGHCAPVIGSKARLDRAHAETETWRAKAADSARVASGWAASFRGSETLRAGEVATARAATASLAQQCDARVAEARRSARVIERIVTKEPTYDENRCPARELVDPRLVRDALSAPAADRATGPGRS